jgi:hypothetical protein
MSELPLDRVRAIAARALTKGATVISHGQVLWDVSGRCQRPVYRHLMGRRVSREFAGKQRTGTALIRGSTGAPGDNLMIEIMCRCRSCPSCLRYRRDLWSSRAARETLAARRTWFGTLTLRPEDHYRVLCQARVDNPDFDQAHPDDQFRMRHEVISKEITKFLKRVREKSGAKIRYLLVTEAHKSGLPHYHLLVHEVTEQRVTQRELAKDWKSGFSKWKLLTDPAAISYVCKYLAKDDRARVRASIRYGKDESLTTTEGGSLGGTPPPQKSVLRPSLSKTNVKSDPPNHENLDYGDCSRWPAQLHEATRVLADTGQDQRATRSQGEAINPPGEQPTVTGPLLPMITAPVFLGDLGNRLGRRRRQGSRSSL